MGRRFVECKGCKKKGCVIYQRIQDDKVVEVEACKDCPELAKQLYRTQHDDFSALEQQYEGICCESCHTKSSDIIEGTSCGCSECYHIFKDLILNCLKRNDFIPSPIYSIFSHTQDSSLHKGKSPFESQDIKLSHRLANLHEALNEALKIENYEQAAWIRDRIRNLSKEASSEESELR